MIIKKKNLFIIGLFLFIVGSVSLAVKIATSMLVIMDDAEFLLPVIVAAFLGAIGGIFISSATEFL
jgi:hypothetical protein